jgi:phosphoribosyl-AMP cyclohydrolase
MERVFIFLQQSTQHRHKNRVAFCSSRGQSYQQIWAKAFYSGMLQHIKNILQKNNSATDRKAYTV